MRTLFGLSVVGLSVFLTTVTIAQQSVKNDPGAAKPAAAQGSPYRPVASVKDIMAAMISPSSKVIFDAVSAVESPTGLVQKAPKNDEEWDNVRNNAIVLVEGANLLMMSGRRIAMGSGKPSAKADAGAEQIELPSDQIEKLVAKDRATWIRFAQKFSDAAKVALDAANRKSADGISDADEGIDTACENCHLKYWYPDQEKLLADAAKRQQKK
jgi:hypothetical protein